MSENQYGHMPSRDDDSVLRVALDVGAARESKGDQRCLE